MSRERFSGANFLLVILGSDFLIVILGLEFLIGILIQMLVVEIETTFTVGQSNEQIYKLILNYKLLKSYCVKLEHLFSRIVKKTKKR